jgi:gluconate 5-dehydrogenase
MGACSHPRRAANFPEARLKHRRIRWHQDTSGAFMAPFNLTNELAVITGGASGIGLAIAECMADVGARVVLVGRREEALAEAQARIGDQAGYLCHDVANTAAADKLISEVNTRFGSPSILVNNAGNHLKKFAVDTGDAEFQEVLQTHLLGGFALTRAVLPAMLERGAGNIIFVSSMAAYLGIPQVVAYAAAKSALSGLIRTLATEVSPSGVRVNGIAPGWIETDMIRKSVYTDEQRMKKILSRTPAGRFGQPVDIGWAAVYLASPAARFVTGTILNVDGGASIGF